MINYRAIRYNPAALLCGFFVPGWVETGSHPVLR